MAEPDETVVADPGWVWVLLWLTVPLIGGGLGWLLKLAVGWITSLPVAPLPGWVRLLGDLPEPWATSGAVGLGVLAGLAFCLHAQGESLAVRIGTRRVVLARGEVTTELTRDQVGAVFLDGKQLVLLGRAGDELAREASDLDGRALEAAFLGRGYPWCGDGDPHRDTYRRWVPGLPELPAGTDVLFQARERALAKGDDADAADLRAELSRLGIVVRDEKPRQYWRRHDGAATA